MIYLVSPIFTHASRDTAVNFLLPIYFYGDIYTPRVGAWIRPFMVKQKEGVKDATRFDRCDRPLSNAVSLWGRQRCLAAFGFEGLEVHPSTAGKQDENEVGFRKRKPGSARSAEIGGQTKQLLAGYWSGVSPCRCYCRCRPRRREVKPRSSVWYCTHKRGRLREPSLEERLCSPTVGHFGTIWGKNEGTGLVRVSLPRKKEEMTDRATSHGAKKKEDPP